MGGKYQDQQYILYVQMGPGPKVQVIEEVILNIRINNCAEYQQFSYDPMPYYLFNYQANVHLWPKAPAQRGKLSASAVGMGEGLWS